MRILNAIRAGLVRASARLKECQSFRYEQEPIFAYKSHAIIDDRYMGLWVVAYTERLFRVSAALHWAAHDEYRLWYILPDVIGFVRELGMDMEVAQGSRNNVREALDLEMLYIIETTRFEELQDSWKERNSRSVD